MESACNETMAGETVMSPVRISDKMPEQLLKRRTLDIRLWQTITAMRCLHDKGVDAYFARDLVGEIDQRLATNVVSPMLNILHNRGLLKCLTPDRAKGRSFTVISWDKLNKFQTALAEHPEHLSPAIDWRAVARKPLEVCSPGEDQVNFSKEDTVPMELQAVTEELPVVNYVNGRKKVGWFKRWFTNAELVEEVRETNRRLESLLEVWS